MFDKNNPYRFLNFTAAAFLTGVTFYLLKELQAIILPVFLAIIITFIFYPLYKFLITKKIPAGISIVIVVLVIIIISNIYSLFIVTSINSFSQEFPKYEHKFADLYSRTITSLNLSDNEVQNLNNTFNLKNLFSGGKLSGIISGIFSSLTGLMGNYILILFYVIFMLSEVKSIRTRIKLAFSEEREERIYTTLIDIFSDVKNYISGKTLLSFIQAVVIGTVLWIFGVDFFIIWAFLFFLTDFIPNIGSLIASILVTLVMILQFEGIILPLIILAILIVIQNLKGNIIEPKIFGKRLDLSPLLLFFSLIFWGYIWGIVGMILSVPIMSMIKITLINIPQTKPLAILMSNTAE